MYKSIGGKQPGMGQAHMAAATSLGSRGLGEHRHGGLLLSFQLVSVSRKGLFKTYLLLVYLLHPHVEPAMAKEKHRHPEGSQDEGLKGQQS